MKDFKEKVAVVTGGASGIGFTLAQKAVEKGARVVLADIRTEALAEAKSRLEALGGEVMTIPTDVTRLVISKRWPPKLSTGLAR